MTQKLHQAFAGAALLAVAAILSVTFMAHPANAQNLQQSVDCGSNIELSPSTDCEVSGGKNSNSIEGVIKTIINILSAIVGSVSVIMIIVGGFKYVTSNGDSNNVSSAKNTILYALVGLLIVAFAQIIVQFVLERT